jgi:hypothetical protein
MPPQVSIQAKLSKAQLFLRFAVAVFLVAATVCLSAYYFYTWGDHTWRQKLTVTVATPQGEVSGSAVTEVKMHLNTVFKDGARYQYKIRGEATVVDLGNGKYLFALLGTALNPDANARLLPEIIAKSVKAQGRDWRDEDFEKVYALTNPAEVPADLMPMLVTFGDMNAPASLKEIKHGSQPIALAQNFVLKSVKVEVTDELVTMGKMEILLPWLLSLRTRLIPTNKKFADEYLPIENVGPEYFVNPFKGGNQ